MARSETNRDRIENENLRMYIWYFLCFARKVVHTTLFLKFIVNKIGFLLNGHWIHTLREFWISRNSRASEDCVCVDRWFPLVLVIALSSRLRDANSLRIASPSREEVDVLRREENPSTTQSHISTDSKIRKKEHTMFPQSGWEQRSWPKRRESHECLLECGQGTPQLCTWRIAQIAEIRLFR